jgi:hypothetical protein
MSATPIILDRGGQRYCLRAVLVAQVRYRRVAPGGPYALTSHSGRELGELQPEVPAAADAADAGFAIVYADEGRETKLWAVDVREVPDLAVRIGA